MVMFLYSATDSSGKISKGERDAENAKALAVLLRKENLLLLEAKERDSSGFRLNIDIGDLTSRFRPISSADKMFFARNLSVMVSAGLSLTRALDALEKEATNKKFKRVIADTSAAVARGVSFAEALRRHREVFNDLFINMVEVGEATGRLSLVLKLVGNQMKRDRTLLKRVRGAMMYPGVILVTLVIIGGIMMRYVVPTLTATIIDLGVPLPLSTRIVIGTSDFLSVYGWVVMGGLVVLTVSLWRIKKIPAVKNMLGRYVLKLPIFGSLIQKLNTARFCRTLACLITSGVPIIRSLEITAGVVGNSRFRDVLREAIQGVEKGVQLNVLFARYPDVFPSLVTQMLAVGEETGKIGEMLLRLALFFEEEVASITKNLSTIIEPILMVLIGLVVGIFAVSMLQPIYSSLGNIG